MLDFSHLGGIGIDMLLTQLHLKRSCRCLPFADHSDGDLCFFQATSLIRRLRTRPPWYLVHDQETFWVMEREAL
jgi:hypothetical protein